MANPFNPLGKKTTYEIWQENQKKQKASKSPVRTNQGGDYVQKNYTGSSETRKTSYEWEKALLKPLPAKSYGRSYADKYDSWAASKGLSPSEAKEFRTWMDSKDDGVKTKSSLFNDILSGGNTRAEESLKRNPIKPSTKNLDAIKKPEKKTGFVGLIDSLKNSEVGRATGSAMQAINPFDNVSAKDAINNYLKHTPSNTAQEVQRGANRAVDSASLGIMSNLDKKVNKREPYYNSQRKFGEGGGTDMITSGLGYLVPGLGGAKLVKGAGLGVKAGSTGLAKLGQLAREGAITGGGIGAAEAGIREALNPQDNNWKQNLDHVALSTMLGGAGDLALGGAGMALKGASNKAMRNMLPSNESLGQRFADVLGPNPERLGLPEPQLGLPKPIMTNPRTSGPVNVKGTPLLTGPTQTKPIVQAYDKEFNNAVEQQFQYLKNSMGKGTTPGGLIKDREGYVTGAFGRVSNNPKWYQDFYASTGRKPNNQELRDLAVQHVKQGFADEGGQIPPWRPQAVKEIDNQIDQAMSYIRQDPTQEPALRPILSALQEERSNAVKPYDWLNDGTNATGNIDNVMPKITDSPTIQGNPLNFRKEQIAKKVPLSYVGKMSPQDMVAQRSIRKPLSTTEGPSLDRLRPGKDYEPIEAMKGNGGPLIDSTKVKKSNIDQTVGNADTARAKISDKPPKKKPSLNNLITQFTDDAEPMRKVEKDVTGEIASAENSLYKQARLFRGSAEKAHLIVKEQLGPIFNAAKKANISLKDARDYALMVHARDVNEKGINSGFTNAEIDDVIRKYGSPEMEAIRKKMLAVNNNTLDILTKGEKPVLDTNGVKAMREKWPNYMSLFREFDDDKVDFASGVSKAMSVGSSPIHKLEGSNRNVIDPFESMVKNIFKATNVADRNKVASQLDGLAAKDTEGQFIRKLADGEEAGRLNVISSMDNGKKVNYEVPPDVYKAMKNLDKESSNTLIRMLQIPASTLRAGATLTPEFSLRNPLRDIPNAFVVSKSGFNPVVDFPVGLWQSIWKGRTIKIGNKEFKTSGDLYKQFIKENGGYGNIVSMDRKLHRETLKKALTDSSTDYIDVLDPKTYAALIKKVVNIKDPLSPLRNIADVSETATKVGEFRAAKRKGVSNEEAAYRARDIMDFARAGISVREANKVVAFLNANIQGKSKLFRAFKENPVKVTGKAVAAVTIPTIGAIVAQETLANDKQREILDDSPQWLKDTFYLVPIPGTDQIARIPKPFDLAYPFSNTLERAFDYVKKNDKKAFDGFIKESFSAAAVPTMLTGLAPIVEGVANYSFFRQGPIIPQREQNLNFPDQYDINTTETAKLLGKGINKVTGGEGLYKNFGSPRVVDSSIQGFFGGLGVYGTSAIDYFINKVDSSDKPEKPAKSIDQQPLAKAFLVNKNTSASLDKLYNLKEKIGKDRSSAKQNETSFNKEEQYKEINKVTKAIGDINKEIRGIENSMDISAQDKRARIDRRIQDRNELAKQTVKKYKE